MNTLINLTALTLQIAYCIFLVSNNIDQSSHKLIKRKQYWSMHQLKHKNTRFVSYSHLLLTKKKKKQIKIKTLSIPPPTYINKFNT